MPDCVLNPVRLKGEPEISGPCLFWVNPGDTPLILKEAKKLQASRYSLFHSNLFQLPAPSSIFWAGPAMGAPMAVFCLEKLIACGAQDIVVFGICGSIVNHLKIGDIFMPTWCYSEEGTSSHYPTGQARDLEGPAINQELREDLHLYLSKYLHAVQGPIWTTDAPYRETKSKITEYQKKGIMAVDMELAALATVARFRGVRLAAALIVSDELGSLQWRPGYSHKIFRQNRIKLFQTINRYFTQQDIASAIKHPKKISTTESTKNTK